MFSFIAGALVMEAIQNSFYSLWKLEKSASHVKFLNENIQACKTPQCSTIWFPFLKHKSTMILFQSKASKSDISRAGARDMSHHNLMLLSLDYLSIYIYRDNAVVRAVIFSCLGTYWIVQDKGCSNSQIPGQNSGIRFSLFSDHVGIYVIRGAVH